MKFHITWLLPLRRLPLSKNTYGGSHITTHTFGCVFYIDKPREWMRCQCAALCGFLYKPKYLHMVMGNAAHRSVMRDPPKSWLIYSTRIHINTKKKYKLTYYVLNLKEIRSRHYVLHNYVGQFYLCKYSLTQNVSYRVVPTQNVSYRVVPGFEWHQSGVVIRE